MKKASIDAFFVLMSLQLQYFHFIQSRYLIHTFKPVCANVDFYSGFLYTMLGIPEELFTPIFAISRISGWSAHRLEELVNKGKIIRPAYKYVGHHREYIPMEERVEES